MNIGLDIDNVITDFDGQLLKELIKEDKNKRNTGIINPKADHITQGMFDWSAEEMDGFLCQNMEEIARHLSARRDCRFYMDKLLQEGDKLFLISHRTSKHYRQPLKTTTEWLKKHNIHYTELILSKLPDKSEECKRYNIDLMVDDRVDQVRLMIESGVNCILMLTKYNKNRKKGLKNAKSWKNLYLEIEEWKKGM